MSEKISLDSSESVFKKQDNLSAKTRTCFWKKSYVFSGKVVRVFRNPSTENKSAC